MKNIDKDILVPEISFKLTNISKDKVKNLKVKIVFLENNKPFSEEIKVVAMENKPLNNDSSTPQINIFAAQPVNYALETHKLQAKIYISQKSPDEWTLFRNINIVWEPKSDIILKN